MAIFFALRIGQLVSEGVVSTEYSNQINLKAVKGPLRPYYALTLTCILGISKSGPQTWRPRQRISLSLIIDVSLS